MTHGASPSVILVANKNDLVRNRSVSDDGNTRHMLFVYFSPGASIPMGHGGHVPPIFGLGDIITNVPPIFLE